MNLNSTTINHADLPKEEALLMTAQQAASELAICTRTLWTLTNSGEIRCVRIGRAVRYDPNELREFIREKRDLNSEKNNPTPS